MESIDFLNECGETETVEAFKEFLATFPIAKQKAIERIKSPHSLKLHAVFVPMRSNVRLAEPLIRKWADQHLWIARFQSGIYDDWKQNGWVNDCELDPRDMHKYSGVVLFVPSGDVVVPRRHM